MSSPHRTLHRDAQFLLNTSWCIFHITPNTMPNRLQKNRCGPRPRDTVHSSVLSQTSSTSHVSKCSTAETHRAPVPETLAQGFLQKPRVFSQNTGLDGSQGEEEAAGFSFQLPCGFFSYFCFCSSIWKAGNRIPSLSIWSGLETVKGRSSAETGPSESIRLCCHYINPELQTHIFCRFMLA